MIKGESIDTNLRLVAFLKDNLSDLSVQFEEGVYCSRRSLWVT